MLIRHAILELLTYPSCKQSSIILNNEIIITSSIVLDQFFKELPSKESQSLTDFLKHSKKLIKIQENNQFEYLKTIKFNIICDDTAVDKSPRILKRYSSNLLYLFNCENIRKSIHTILQNLNHINNDNLETLLSSFIVLNIVRPNNQTHFYNIKDFTHSLLEYCKSSKAINKLDDVLTICTPFGLENFYKTVNIGKISNILGEKNSVFVISNTLPQGCEGSAVLNSKLRLIGILICTSLRKDNDDFSLSLVGNFDCIIKDFITEYGFQIKPSYLKINRQPSNWEKSLVIITSSSSQGTGTLVKVLDKKIILTCSHVLLDNDLITCRYIDGTFTTTIIWKNPNYNEPFDIALLSVPTHIPDNYFVGLSDMKPRIGQSIYNAGFPFLTNIETNQKNFTPSIFDGRIIKYSPGILISDGNLQSGQSGGPMFDENGSVIAICVSNLKLNEKIYPNINTSVPICDIKNILRIFAKNNDEKILNDLIASAMIKMKWALEKPFIESKL